LSPGSLGRRAEKKQEIGDRDIAQTTGVDLPLNAIHLLFGAAFADPPDRKELTGN
jgi:hypothetical protein